MYVYEWGELSLSLTVRKRQRSERDAKINSAVLEDIYIYLFLMYIVSNLQDYYVKSF